MLGGTFRANHRRPRGEVHQALLIAGYEPEVVKTGGCYRTDPLFPGRREVKRLTGNYKVPTLILHNGTVIDGSQNIIKWAHTNEAVGLSE